MKICCPHCKEEREYPGIETISPDRNPEMRKKVRDLSCFRVTCPNCGETMLAVQPCLYHDMTNRFMVWLWPSEDTPPKADFDPLAGYTLRLVDTLNAFREKIVIFDLGLDDRAVEVMKLILFMQLTHDLDVIELLFHEFDEATGDFRFVAILSDGVEQYVAMPGAVYQKLKKDIDERLFTSPKEFSRIDVLWAQETLELLHDSN